MSQSNQLGSGIVNSLLEPDREDGSVPDEWEQVDEPSINDVYRTADGDYAKVFGSYPFEALKMKTLNPGSELQTGEKRKENELESYPPLEASGFRVPEVIDEHSRTIIKESTPGENFGTYISEKPPEDVYQGCRAFGERLRALHEKDCAMMDPAPRNFMIEEEEGERKFWAIDSEFFVQDADSQDKAYDLKSLDKKLKTLERQRYLTAMIGLEEGYQATQQDTKSSWYSIPPTGNLRNYALNTLAENTIHN